jgi:hypothetical protein
MTVLRYLVSTTQYIPLLSSLILPPLCSAAPSSSADILIDFNRVIYQIAEREDGFLTLKGLRTATMMHIAAHDALNAIEPQYTSYVYEENSGGTNRIAATAQAAFAVADEQFPKQGALIELHKKWLDTVASPEAKQTGIALGNKTATAILQQRRGDGWDSQAEYQFHPMAPGVYAEFNQHSGTPEGFVFGAGWGKAKGFALSQADKFRVPPPPNIDSEEYTQAFKEVKNIGRFQSFTRTPDQTHIALWWKDFIENSHNRLARDLVAREKLSLTEAARFFALLNMSIYDAYISSFDNKFHYNHWRPYTAIRWASNDGNPDTEEEASWNNTHRHTYAFPSYPSAHGTACGAAATILAEVFGDKTRYDMRNPVADIAGPFSGKINMQPPTRSFNRFSEAATECGLSRVYLGIHFRYDSEAGVKLGRKVGRHVVENYLQAL